MDKFLAFTLKSNGILNMLKTDTLVLSDIRKKILHTLLNYGEDCGIQVLQNHQSHKELLMT